MFNTDLGHDQKKQEKLSVSITNSTIKSVEQPENIWYDTIQEVNVNVAYIEIDCLNIGNLIKYEIKKVTANENSTTNAVYQAHLLVNVDITLNITAKDVAALVVTEIEDGNDYS
ncbi:8499_t:CDS:2 [Cetraspora pellucida]|uniref:8499_t:CDS:1 n=1 Tax=Cetraspora pellucida TaxID=1433469 RepID=A0A9N9BGN0_9GLOM|nr:8499_t:CDS:2 [Cetraspora pellucida]